MELSSLKTPNLHDLIQEQIKQYIISSGLKSGDPLPTEKELSEKLEISRTSIREALKGLESLGIIEVRHGVGSFLKKINIDAVLKVLSYGLEIDIESFKNILEVRICLESYFVSKNINKFTTEDIEELKNILREYEEQVCYSKKKESVITHSDFHCVLNRKTGNSLLINLVKIFSTIQTNLLYRSDDIIGDITQSTKLHKRIIEAIESKDAELLEKRIMEHFSGAIAFIKSDTEENNNI